MKVVETMAINEQLLQGVNWPLQRHWLYFAMKRIKCPNKEFYSSGVNVQSIKLQSHHNLPYNDSDLYQKLYFSLPTFSENLVKI